MTAKVINQYVQRAEQAEAALRDIILTLGTGKCRVNKCEGCLTETREALRLARAVLSAGGSATNRSDDD